MKAIIQKPMVTVTLQLTSVELKNIISGLGNVSPESLERVGMSKDQAAAIGLLFFALDEANKLIRRIKC